MNIRHLVTKSFDSDVEKRRSVLYNGVPLCIQLDTDDIKDSEEVTLEFNKYLPPELNISQSLNQGKKMLVESPLGDIVADKKTDDILPLSKIYDFEVKAGSELSKTLPVGINFDDLIENDDINQFMRDTAESMFPNINPNTGVKDINREDFYTPYIPLVVLTGAMTPQIKDELTYFNPSGTVSVAEFLDGLNSIKFGCNSNVRRKKTLDRISDENDYFNEGYQDCVRGISSPFFNLYTRHELVKPITRVELAYITVICWNQFIDKYNNLYGGQFYLGINFDWENPAEYLDRFEDGFNYKVSKVVMDKDYDVISLSIKDYKSDRAMSEYKEDLLRGISPIPLPMFMSLIELDLLNLFYYENRCLDPLKEVSRGELCYFLNNLAKLFPMKYINNKEER